jgi:hypothetical protein
MKCKAAIVDHRAWPCEWACAGLTIAISAKLPKQKQCQNEDTLVSHGLSRTYQCREL